MKRKIRCKDCFMDMTEQLYKKWKRLAYVEYNLSMLQCKKEVKRAEK